MVETTVNNIAAQIICDTAYFTVEGSMPLSEFEKLRKPAYMSNLLTQATGASMLHGGAFYKNGIKVFIREVIYNDPVFIVVWSDGTRTSSKCEEGDKFNADVGLLICVLKKLMGSDFAVNLLEDWYVTGTSGKKTLKDVRRQKRLAEKKS